jgi:hypothetical protein
VAAKRCKQDCSSCRYHHASHLPFPRPTAELEHRTPNMSIEGCAATDRLSVPSRARGPRQSASMAPTSASATIVPLTLASP